MARYMHELRLLSEPNSTFKAIHDYLISEKFQYVNFEGEMVFKKGDGWVTAPTFIKVTFGPETVRVESWIKYAVLPGMFAGEMGWDGFVGCAGKGTMKRCTRQIETMLGNVSVSKPGDYTPTPGQPLPAPGLAPAPTPGYAPQAAPAPSYAPPAAPAPEAVPAPGYAPQAAPAPSYSPPAAPAPTPAPAPAQNAVRQFCPSCGETVTPGVRFCSVCGRQLF